MWPNRQLCPGAQSAAVEHEQYDWLSQLAVAPGPHWVLVEQGPQTPFTHAYPPLQSALERQAGMHTWLLHASPDAQSRVAVQPQDHFEPLPRHWALGPHWMSAEQPPHMPASHTSPMPHWSFPVHAPQPPSAQICPAVHWLLELQLVHAGPVHATHALYVWQPEATAASGPASSETDAGDGVLQ
jgi:hypothetical protein